MPLPKEIVWLSEVFTKAGAELYVVGGSVRDFVISIVRGGTFHPKDFDLVTNLHPDAVVRLLQNQNKSNLSIKEVGKSFGVVLVKLDDQQFEIATFREDSQTGDGRRPDYVTFSTIDKDAERRDLTVNALYYDLAQKFVLDFHGGLRDIHSNRIRFVGDAEKRIHEDKLRVMRFARFFNRVNDDNISKLCRDTKEVIRKCNLRECASAISDERIREEFIKGMTPENKVKNYLLVLEDLGLLKQVFPSLEVKVNIKDSSLPLEGLVSQILQSNEPKLICEKLLKLKWTKDEAESVSFLVELPNYTLEMIVEFRVKRRKIKTSDCLIKNYSYLNCNKNQCNLIRQMLEFPFPSVPSESVISEGFQGKNLGLEIRRREIENFKVWKLK